MLLQTTIYLLLASAIGSILCFNYAIVKYYSDPHESVKLAVFIQVMSLAIVWIFMLVVPFDVYATVRHWDSLSQFRIWDLYICCCSLLVALIFIGLPFSYYFSIITGKIDDKDLITPDGETLEETLGMKGLDSSSDESEEEDMFEKPRFAGSGQK
jgi:hypothetical protein